MTRALVKAGDRVYYGAGEWVVLARQGEVLTLRPMFGGPCVEASVFQVALSERASKEAS